MNQIHIVLAGPTGNMGQEIVKLIERTPQFQLEAVVDVKPAKGLNELLPFYTKETPVYADLQECIDNHPKLQVMVDVTNPDVGKRHLQIAVANGLRGVIGTTGFNENELAELGETIKEKKTGVIIAPNFAVGAVLMMKFSKMAAQYFPDVEIIELHHDRKLDAPSGTAIKTAEMIGQVREPKKQGHPDEKETIKGARGGDLDGIHIHSVRLPGLVAHQEVLFGGNGQLLSIKHDSFNRESFMSGVKLSIETVMNLEELVYGLEHIID